MNCTFLSFSLFFNLTSHGKTSVPVSTPTIPETEKPATEKNINLGKRKKSEPSDGNSGADDLDSVIMSEPRKKIQKLTHSNAIDGKLVEKKK